MPYFVPGSDIVQWMIKNLNVEDQGNTDRWTWVNRVTA